MMKVPSLVQLLDHSIERTINSKYYYNEVDIFKRISDTNKQMQNHLRKYKLLNHLDLLA